MDSPRSPANSPSSQKFDQVSYLPRAGAPSKAIEVEVAQYLMTCCGPDGKPSVSSAVLDGLSPALQLTHRSLHKPARLGASRCDGDLAFFLIPVYLAAPTQSGITNFIAAC